MLPVHFPPQSLQWYKLGIIIITFLSFRWDTKIEWTISELSGAGKVREGITNIRPTFALHFLCIPQLVRVFFFVPFQIASAMAFQRPSEYPLCFLSLSVHMGGCEIPWQKALCVCVCVYTMYVCVHHVCLCVHYVCVCTPCMCLCVCLCVRGGVSVCTPCMRVCYTTCMCVSVCVHHVCVCAHVDARGQLGVIPQVPVTSLFETRCLKAPKLADLVRSASQWDLGIFLFPPQHPGIKVHAAYCGFLSSCWRSRSKDLCCVAGVFFHWTISTALQAYFCDSIFILIDLFTSYFEINLRFDLL